MIVRFRRGNMTETRPVLGELDHHVSAGRKRDGYKQLPVSVEFTKYGSTLFRPVSDNIPLPREQHYNYCIPGQLNSPPGSNKRLMNMLDISSPRTISLAIS